MFGHVDGPPGAGDIKGMTKRERLIWKLVGIVVLTLISVLLVTVVVFHLLG